MEMGCLSAFAQASAEGLQLIEAIEQATDTMVAIKVSDAMKTIARLIVFMLLLISICS